MSLPRLPFLYPHLFKSPRVWAPSVVRSPHSTGAESRRVAQFHSTRRRAEESFTQRYGPAAEPLPPTEGEEATKEATKEGSPVKIRARVGLKSAGKNPKSSSSSFAGKKASKAAQGADAKAGAEKETPSFAGVPIQAIRDADESHPPESSTAFTIEGTEAKASAALDKVLLMEAPTAPKLEQHKTPHMQPTPYIHHFDTYTLVKDLGKGTFTEEQSITIMKAVRSLLAVNLDLARDGLVSKSDVENETYLFRAACSELRTEIQNSRKRTSESQRAERTHLQHEADILNQKVTQESQTLKDDLKGMFDDRKMDVRMEQRGMDSNIQELNHKITIALMGDSKGEVEALRWFLTRRAALVIGSVVLSALLYLRYTTHIAHLEELERKKNLSSSSASSGTGYTTPSRSSGTQTVSAGTETALEVEGSNYVGLG